MKYSKGKSEFLMVAVIDCLWNSISTSENMKKFIQQEGIDLTIDILEVCPSSAIKNQLLSFLIHVTSHFPESVTALQRWQSDRTQIRIHQLLIDLWKAEESRLGSKLVNF